MTVVMSVIVLREIWKLSEKHVYPQGCVIVMGEG